MSRKKALMRPWALFVVEAHVANGRDLPFESALAATWQGHQRAVTL